MLIFTGDQDWQPGISMNRDRPLFSSGDLSRFIGGAIAAAKKEAGQLGADAFNANSIEQIVGHICSGHSIDLVKLDLKNLSRSMGESSAEVPDQFGHSGYGYPSATRTIPSYLITSTIPVEGDIELLNLQPSVWSSRLAQGEICGNTLVVSINIPSVGKSSEEIVEEAEKEFKEEIGIINEMASRVNSDLRGYQNSLHSAVRTATINRKEELEKIQKIQAALKVSVKPSKNASPLNRAPIKPKSITPLSKRVEEPGIYVDDGDYELILEAIRGMATTMESTDMARGLGETNMRDILLVGLNSSLVLGPAVGEQFRKTGKTDIAIMFKNRAAFVAECKLWSGPANLTNGLDQLLRYLTWRDSKTALIFFNNRNADFSSIQKKVEPTLRIHPNFVESNTAKDGEWRFVFSKPDDGSRHITVHVFLVDIYQKHEAQAGNCE